MKLFEKRLRTADRGQAILIIALAMVAIAAFVGLMTDVGVLFIEYGKLKRGIDAGAIAAAQQFRRDFTGDDLRSAATNFLSLNSTSADNINVYRCKEIRVAGVWVEDTTADGTLHDATLCTDPHRKLIRLEAERRVDFGFLRVIGIDSTTIKASSVGEAASIDLVLVIDTSSSMSYDTAGDPNQPQPDNPLDDPFFCNDPLNATPCQPLTSVKTTALDFLNTMFFPYDRVSIVAMTSQVAGGTRDHTTVLPLSDDPTAVAAAINSLRVFEPPNCFTNPTAGSCLEYDSDGNPDTYEASGTFIKVDCPAYWNTGDPSSCQSSNIGGALLRASSEFTAGVPRKEALWITILLAGGPANATDPADGKPYGFCPDTTWDVQPWCRDTDVPTITRHSPGPPPDPEFDADDYARWRADFLADPIDGQGITIFTIGLGDYVRNTRAGLPDSGERLLTYIAEEAGDRLGPPPVTANHGFYSYTPNTAGLADIFTKIAENIFTRIAQ